MAVAAADEVSMMGFDAESSVFRGSASGVWALSGPVISVAVFGSVAIGWSVELTAGGFVSVVVGVGELLLEAV